MVGRGGFEPPPYGSKVETSCTARKAAGTARFLHADPANLKKWGLQAGVDYVGSNALLFGARPVAGLDYRALEENDWRGRVSVKAGLSFGRHEPQPRGITVLLEYYDGPSPFGQFYHDVVFYYGVALQFHH